MSDPQLVRRFERVGDLPRDRQGFIERDGAALDALRQVLPFDQFHDDGSGPMTLFEAVDGGDVGMVQRGEHFRLALKPRQPIGVRRHRRRQRLDRDLTLQLGVGRPIHLPHPALADLGGDVVDAETRAGSEGQRWRNYTGRPGVRIPRAFSNMRLRKAEAEGRPPQDKGK